MKKSTQILIATILGLFQLQANAQNKTSLDTIYTFQDKTITCNVKEMTTTEVKYTYPSKPGITLAIENELVNYIRLSTGEKVSPSNNEKKITQLAYDKQRRANIKLGLFTPLQGYTDLGFEYSLRPQKSLEATLGIIGLGSDDAMLDPQNSEDKGASLTFGYKVYAGPDFHLRKVRNAHRMSGIYVKPTVSLAYYKSESSGTFYDRASQDYSTQSFETSTLKSALTLQVGRQYIFGDIISLDLNIGAGYGTKSKNYDNTPFNVTEPEFSFDIDPNYGFRVFGNSNFTLSSAFKIGILLK